MQKIKHIYNIIKDFLLSVFCACFVIMLFVGLYASTVALLCNMHYINEHSKFIRGNEYLVHQLAPIGLKAFFLFVCIWLFCIVIHIITTGWKLIYTLWTGKGTELERTSFDISLDLFKAGYNAKTEYGWRFFTEKAKNNTKLKTVTIDGVTYREEIKESPLGYEDWDKNTVSIKLGPWDTLKAQLSDRFYDSWNDMLIPAYTVLELTELDDTLRVSKKDNPNTIAQEILNRRN